ncbi:unnamed protein product [Ixodes pacificus]
MDAMERGIRARQREAEERKRRILAAYATVAKTQGAGPKTVCLEEYTNLAVPEDVTFENPYSCTTGFKGGIAIIQKHEEASKNAFAKFQQMDSSANRGRPAAAPNFRGGSGGVARSASDIKEMLLSWCKNKTRGYAVKRNVSHVTKPLQQARAWCFMLYFFFRTLLEFDDGSPSNGRKNPKCTMLSNRSEQAGIAPLLDVEDMVLMKKPDWKCVFTYVQSLYRNLVNKD